jgi:hypothetical protein
MTKSWKMRHWLIAIVIICLVILLFAGGTGAAEGIRITLTGILHLLGQIIQQLLGLLGQLINKIGK